MENIKGGGVTIVLLHYISNEKYSGKNIDSENDTMRNSNTIYSEMH